MVAMNVLVDFTHIYGPTTPAVLHIEGRTIMYNDMYISVIVILYSKYILDRRERIMTDRIFLNDQYQHLVLFVYILNERTYT